MVVVWMKKNGTHHSIVAPSLKTHTKPENLFAYDVSSAHDEFPTHIRVARA